jgi:hypothetical protein
VDQSEQNLTLAKETCRTDSNVEFVLGNGLSVVSEKGPFDVTLLLHVLEHLDCPEDSLRHVREHSKRVVIEVPNFGSDPLNFLRLREDLPCYSDDDHTNEFSLESLAACLTSSGWNVRELRACNWVILAAADAPETGN